MFGQRRVELFAQGFELVGGHRGLELGELKRCRWRWGTWLQSIT
jgi:hypothetical protein